MKNRLVKRLFVLFLSIVLISSCFNFTAFAGAAPKYDYDYGCNLKLLNGVGDWGNNTRYYYITSSASSYTNTITDAVNSWVYTTSRLNYSTPISISRTTTQSSSVFDIYLLEQFSENQGVLGVTYHYIGNTNLNAGADQYPSQSWYWSKIILNQPNFVGLTSQNGMSGTLCRQSVVAHEFGHALGLAHSTALNNAGYPNDAVIMIQLTYGRSVWQPMKPDLEVINHLYT